MKTLSFRGGVHPPGKKHLSSDRPIEALPLPERVFMPLSQHIGAPAEPIVKRGDSVKAGQKIAEAKGFVSAPVHSSVSGRVTAIKKHPHPISGSAEAVIIDRENDDWEDFAVEGTREGLSPEEIINAVREAGVVGLGGACFPTAVKLSPPVHAKIDTLIINGAECEPYLSSDYRLMLEHAPEIISGARMLMSALKARRCVFAIEDNKPLAAAEIKKAAGSDIEVAVLNTKYPQGGEKQLIQAVLKREVPSGGLPLDAGVVVDNAATAFAVKEAVADGKPLVERVVSVTGENIKNPKNLRVRLGTPFADLAAYCGGLKSSGGKLISGGPMMGIAQYSMEAPVIKGTSGLLALLPGQALPVKELNCIRCGSCADVCPIGLVPSDLAKLAKKAVWDELGSSGLNDCIECGCCSYTCPAGIPIVHYIKYAKARALKNK